jgi:predicted nucleotidyltransferase
MVKKSINNEIMESIKKYIEKISQYYNIEAIILFGSYAKGTENEDSDIDIAIISSDFKDVIEDGAKLIGLTWKIDTRIEPHPITTDDYKKVSNPFVREVMDTGIKVA